MFKRKLAKKIGIDLKLASVNVILVANAFVWYFLAFNILRGFISALNLPDFEALVIFGVNFVGIAVSGLFGSILVDKFKKRLPFLYSWMFAGIFFSLIPLVFKIITSFELMIISALYGTYFGLGMPATMGYYSASTSTENRSKLGGIIFLLIGLSFSVLGNIGVGDINLVSVILATVRMAGLLLLFLLKTEEQPSPEPGKVTFAYIVSNRSFMLYFIPWCMFSLVNYMTVPVASKIFLQGEEFIRFSIIFENILTAAFAVVSGFFADIFGRKRLIIMGFAMLGIGYAVLGMAPYSTESVYFYIFVDGVAWGFFYTIILFTLWGDLAQGRNSDKFYVIGALPYLFSNFMRLLLGSYVSQIPETAIFSFASIFLFLAVLPLYYAPETLPEKTIKERELKSYIEKAKKAKEKYA